ncbi:MerR family transcriptional regulator [Candidatus Rhodobacter oscarellae]|uniref:MerR family transcriptional regulator n=1 Tax=Candidatus Rhodobacter oscarellae TaxID=1675527 RepID=A0A0J9EDS2_9RHOB|nr:MerR family transcriptional regulator [Candidatus Rhodobacter lobularis]KMW59884.1 MerR family transcriptional regulator [Candidatus Rhodobacter lobularis]
MRIAEASEACGLSAYTIRFYEKSGMLPKIERGPDGHRRFTPRLIEWLTLLYWLRETGMSLKQMRRFTTLAKAGDTGIAERRKILADHADTLKAKRAKLEKCEEVLAIKIASYGPDTKEDDP